MARLDHIVMREIRLPLREPFRISSGVVRERRIPLLELHDADGVSTWSECVALERPMYNSEALDTAWHAICEWVAPRVIGREFAHPGDIHQVLEEDFRGNQMAKASIEMGMWALEATRQGLPLAKFIGGNRNGLREHIATGISLGIMPTPESLVEKARAAFAEGYRKIKIKIAPGRDVAYVRAVREALGADAPLMADANNAYQLSDADLLAELDELDLMMIEQPLAWDDITQHARLQKRLKTPLCLDESITSVEKARDMVNLNAGRIINVKPGRVGGFTSSLAIHDYCVTANVPVWCGGMLESGVGRAYNVALASLPGFTKPGDLSPSSRYWERDVVTPEWTMSADGMVAVPLSSPGLGITVDAGRIDDLTVRTVTLR